MDLSETALSARTITNLRRFGDIGTLDELREAWLTDPRKIRKIRFIGDKQYQEIQNFIMQMEGINPAPEKTPAKKEESVVEVVQFCRHCRQPLQREKWNTKGDILLCNDPDCPCYRAPQDFALIERSMEKVLA